MEDTVTGQVWISSVNKQNKEALSQWVQDNNIVLKQINGQRIFAGPPVDWLGDAPPFGTEAFIGNIPQEIYEDKLIPLFQTAGWLYEFRLMMTFSGLNRGFAYARYATRRQAGTAIFKLNGYEIQPGIKLVVCRSTEKCEILLDGLPCVVNQASLISILCGMTQGVVSLSLFASPTLDMKNIAVIKYSSHKEAAVAKKFLCEGAAALEWIKKPRQWIPKQKFRPQMFICNDIGSNALCSNKMSGVLSPVHLRSRRLVFSVILLSIPFTSLICFISHVDSICAELELVFTCIVDSQLLFGCPYSVEWLNPHLKQKMQSGALLEAHSLYPEKWSSSHFSNKRIAATCVQFLHIVCDQMKLGQPLYQIHFLGMTSCGWLRFQYQVAVPKHSVPFSGSDWLIGENLTPVELFTQAKEMVALKILQKLAACN
ncbi:dead end protein homolog 1-like [Gastrophryne carolinensis]